MKIKIKDLQPNPFRDMKKYPIDQAKIQSLINSIGETGFWDNILARRHPDEADKFQISYGHHRLIAIQKKLGKEAIVDIPIRDLDDETMLRIMAEENNESYKTDVAIIDETIKVVFEYLKRLFPLKETVKRGQTFEYFDGLPIPKKYRTILSGQVAAWLGSNWPEKRIYEALDRLKQYKSGRQDERSTQELPQTAAAHFTSAVKKHKPTKEEQKKAVEKIKERQDFSKENIEFRVIDEKYKQAPIKKKKIEKTFEDFLGETIDKARVLRGNLKTILGYKDRINPEFYRAKLMELIKNLAFLDYYIQKFKKGGNKNERGNEPKQIEGIAKQAGTKNPSEGTNHLL